MGLEVIQMQDGGFEEYVKDFYNCVDLAMFVTYCCYFLVRMFDTESTLLPLEAGTSLSQGQVTFLYHMSLLNCFIICQSFLKIMFFLRVFEQFGLLVDLVAQALSDSIPFTCFLIMWLILFSLLFRILGFEIDDGDYSSMGQASIYVLQTYRNSVGDIAAPAYSFWES